MNTALLLIDIQNDYFAGGKNPLEGADPAGRVASGLLSYARAQSLPIVHVQHLMMGAHPPFFAANSEGAKIHQSVAPQEGEMVIVKHYPNAFRETSLLAWLRERGINRLLVGGMMTHMCVDTTVRAAFDLGFATTLIADACATKTLSWGDNQVSALQVQTAYLSALNGTFATVQSAQSWADAKH